ncbi:MAG TPA: hypothetical protein VJ697_14740 [Nitrososphaeraceae archaeon]|nr:hypothetical protein [Nitrososphaeraceae archaeon]
MRYWDNHWVTLAWYIMCRISFDPVTTGNVYKLKKEYFDICFCNECMNELKKSYIKKWDKIEL